MVKKKRKHGEDYLETIAAINIRLEGGEDVEFDLAEELHVPTDPDLVLAELRAIPARLAFWAYQTERALGVVRNVEHELGKVESENDLIFRKWYDEETDETYTEAMIRARVSLDEKVKHLRVKLNGARKNYGILRSARDAMEHRSFVLRRIVAHWVEVP